MTQTTATTTELRVRILGEIAPKRPLELSDCAILYATILPRTLYGSRLHCHTKLQVIGNATYNIPADKEKLFEFLVCALLTIIYGFIKLIA